MSGSGPFKSAEVGDGENEMNVDLKIRSHTLGPYKELVHNLPKSTAAKVPN